MPVIVTGRTRPGLGLSDADEGQQHRARQAKPQAPRLERILGNVPCIPQAERPGMATPSFRARWNDRSRAATLSPCRPLHRPNTLRVRNPTAAVSRCVWILPCLGRSLPQGDARRAQAGSLLPRRRVLRRQRPHQARSASTRHQDFQTMAVETRSDRLMHQPQVQRHSLHDR